MSERSAVQNPLIQYAEAIGWEYLSPEEVLRLRGGESGYYFTDILIAQLQRLNGSIVDDTRSAEIVRQLNLLHPTIEGNRKALSWMRAEQSVYVPDEKRERNVSLINFDDPAKNIFHVTDEWTQKGARFTNRADVVFLINGIPIAFAETKSASVQDGLSIGIKQIRRYHLETPEMFVASQLFEVTQLFDFYYGVTWSTSRKNIFDWKDELVQAGQAAMPSYEDKVKTFFDRQRFLQVLRDYIIFLNKDDVLSKVILRQHQTRAVEKVLHRVADPHKRRGLIWHTQGSGKTLTMITIAARLMRGAAMSAEKPTILMLIDRNELESQLFKNITAYGISSFELASNKRELQRLLASDQRGLIVSMIHKFDDIPANINTREGIVVLVDEAHRTTGGDLGNYLMAALPNATYIGFTGTPIDRIAAGKGTFKVFGGDDEQGYLDKYSIAESIPDGTTVPLNYQLAPSDLRVDRDLLEKQFLNLAESEGVSDPEELNAILDRAVELKEMMKAPGRVANVAAFVARHYRETVEPMGFKAFLVAVDREACALYKEELDRRLPADYSTVVYSSSGNDSALLKKFALSPAAEKDVRRDFLKKDKPPKILIVTEKLLTGFDAPILYCMYLDKPMRDHVLLQAIARVNRPYEDDDNLNKPFGFVLDFVGIFDNLEKALAFDSDVVASVIKNIDVLKELFAKQITGPGVEYLALTRGWDDKAIERAVAAFVDKEKRQKYFKFFKDLQNLYDILSPDAFLRPYIEDYQSLARLYAHVQNAYNSVYVDNDLVNKTKLLLRQHTSGYSIELPGAVYELDTTALAALKKSDADDTTKVLNLRKILAKTAIEGGANQPFLLSIGERAENLALAYEDHQISTQEALARFVDLAQEVIDAEIERQNLGLDANGFAIYRVVKPIVAALTPTQASEINDLFVRLPDYQWNEVQKSRLRVELYKKLRPLVGTRMIEVTNTLIKLQRA